MAHKKLFSSPEQLLNLERHLLSQLLPHDRQGDYTFALIQFIKTHNRMPTDQMIFSDQLFKIKTTNEILNPLRVFTTDKELSKIYIKATVGEEYVIPTIKVLNNDIEIQEYVFPDECVVKPTHTSGSVIKKLSGEKIDKNLVIQNRKINYYHKTREANYRDLLQKIIVEPFIFGNKNISDFKFFCYKGVPKLIQVDFDRYTNHTRSFFDLNWTEQDFQLSHPRNLEFFEKPKTLDLMSDVAASLSKPFDLVRIDLYTNNEKIYVGEITHCHGAASERFFSFEDELKASKLIFD